MIINATPVGMGSNKQSPLEEKELNTKYVFDLVYIPAETKLTKMAVAKGCKSYPGWRCSSSRVPGNSRYWTGKPAPSLKWLTS